MEKVIAKFINYLQRVSGEGAVAEAAHVCGITSVSQERCYQWWYGKLHTARCEMIIWRSSLEDYRQEGLATSTAWNKVHACETWRRHGVVQPAGGWDTGPSYGHDIETKTTCRLFTNLFPSNIMHTLNLNTKTRNLHLPIRNIFCFTLCDFFF